MPDLFTPQSTLEHLPIPDADIWFLPELVLPLPPEALKQALINEVEWLAKPITVWGKTYMQPRLIAWVGDPDRSYTYSGSRMEPTPWTPLLSAVREAVQHAAGAQFNSVLLNYYRHERDSMGYHSDDEKELGPQPVIASLSLGQPRSFVLKHKTDRVVKPVRIMLPSGSLLIMQGETQTHWKHGIDKQSQPCGSRLNLTFRWIIDPAMRS